MANEKKNNKIRSLTLAELQKQSKKLDAQTEETIQINGEDYKVKIDNVFRKTKQYALLDDLVAFLNQSNNKAELLEVATPYVSLLFIKHFTDVEVSDDVDEAIELMNVLIDLDIFNQILNLMPEEEITKVYEILSATTERMKDNIEETLKEIEKAKSVVQNPEVKEMLEDGKS